MDGYESLWQAIDRRIGLKTRELTRPYTAYVEEVDAANHRVRVRLPGEAGLDANTLPWAPVYGGLPVDGAYVFTLVDFPGRRVITGTPQAIGAFSAYKATAQNDIVTSTDTKVHYDGEDFDVSGWYDHVTNFRYTPQLPGFYRLSAFANLNPGVDGGFMRLSIWKNNADFARLGQSHAAGTGSVGASGSLVVQANGSTDYFEVFMWHNLGVSTSDISGSSTLKFTGEYIGTT